MGRWRRAPSRARTHTHACASYVGRRDDNRSTETIRLFWLQLPCECEDLHEQDKFVGVRSAFGLGRGGAWGGRGGGGYRGKKQTITPLRLNMHERPSEGERGVAHRRDGDHLADAFPQLLSVLAAASHEETPANAPLYSHVLCLENVLGKRGSLVPVKAAALRAARLIGPVCRRSRFKSVLWRLP